MDALALEAAELVEKHGSVTEAAKAAGIPRTTLQSRYNKYRATKDVDPAVSEGMRAVGTQMVPQLVWAKTKSEDGTSYSALLKPVRPEEDPGDIAERIAERLNNVRPAPAIHRPKATRSDLRTFIPVFDVHLSMRVGSYGTAEAVQRLTEGSTDLLERSPPAECTIILNGGDFSHQNDPSNLTPQSKHPLPVDAEYDDTTDVATDVTAVMIDRALTHSDHVIYKALRGNHDPQTARILRAALRQRYRNESRVTIEDSGLDFFAHEWSGNLICAHHGDIRRKPQDIVLGFASKYAEAWGRTVYRDLWTGHLHHVKVLEFAGMTTNQVRAVCPADRHSDENLFSSQSEMIAVTYRQGGGRYGVLQHMF